LAGSRSHQARLDLAKDAVKPVTLQPDAGEGASRAGDYYYRCFRDTSTRHELAIARRHLANNAECFEYTG